MDNTTLLFKVIVLPLSLESEVEVAPFDPSNGRSRLTSEKFASPTTVSHSSITLTSNLLSARSKLEIVPLAFCNIPVPAPPKVRPVKYPCSTD